MISRATKKLENSLLFFEACQEFWNLSFPNYGLNQFLPYSEKPEFLPLLGNLISDHCTKPKIYTSNENNPRNFATGCVKLAPNKKLNMFFRIKYKFVDGLSQISHSVEFIKYKQLMFCKL